MSSLETTNATAIHETNETIVKIVKDETNSDTSNDTESSEDVDVIDAEKAYSDSNSDNEAPAEAPAEVPAEAPAEAHVEADVDEAHTNETELLIEDGKVITRIKKFKELDNKLGVLARTETNKNVFIDLRVLKKGNHDGSISDIKITRDLRFSFQPTVFSIEYSKTGDYFSASKAIIPESNILLSGTVKFVEERMDKNNNLYSFVQNKKLGKSWFLHESYMPKFQLKRIMKVWFTEKEYNGKPVIEQIHFMRYIN